MIDSLIWFHGRWPGLSLVVGRHVLVQRYRPANQFQSGNGFPTTSQARKSSGFPQSCGHFYQRHFGLQGIDRQVTLSIIIVTRKVHHLNPVHADNCFRRIGPSPERKANRCAWPSISDCSPLTERPVWNKTNSRLCHRPTTMNTSSSPIRDK